MKRIAAPFTPAQVLRLNEQQTLGWVHPYTCGRCRDNDPAWPLEDEHPLTATTTGWVCPTCDYTQDWAWWW
jgi:hypothetical protein